MEPSFNDGSTRPGDDDQSQFSTPAPSPSPPTPEHAIPRNTSRLTGTKFGKDECFTLQKLRYQGGMGEIWVAWLNEPRSKRRVAIKIIRPDVLSKLSRELFEREIEMHRRVADVPGVLPLVDSGKFTPLDPNNAEGITSQADIRYLATEWISNVRSLDQACKELSWEARINLFARICDTLDVIHKRAIVHCDLKPHNILIDEQGNPLVADFGLAISNLPTDRESTGLDIGSIRGTWSYMAPEQCAKHCDPYGYKASLDVYALGVTFYECLTGSLPYPTDPGKAPTRGEAAKIINEQLHIALRHKGRTLPPQIYAALSKACSNNPSMRFADAGKLGAALRTSPGVERVKEVGYGLATLVAVYVLLLSVFFQITYHYPTYDLFRHVLVKMAPVAQSLDHVVVITTDDPTDEKIDSLANLNGLGKRTSRATFAVILNRLRELDARAVAIDTWFYAPGIPQANDMLLTAINDFEGEHRGKVIIAKAQWVDNTSSDLAPTERIVSTTSSVPNSNAMHAGYEIDSALSEHKGPERYPICAQLKSLEYNIGTACIQIDRQTHFLESELVFRGSNRWIEPSFTLQAVLAYLNRETPAEYQIDWRKHESTFSVSLNFSVPPKNNSPPPTFELSSIRTGDEMNSNMETSPQLYSSDDAVGLFSIGPVPEDQAFQRITLTADMLWDKQHAERIKSLDLKNRLVVIGVAPPPLPERSKEDAAAHADGEKPDSSTASLPQTKETAVAEALPLSREQLEQARYMDPSSYEALLLDYYEANDMHWVGNRWVPGCYLQAALIDSIINDQTPGPSDIRARMTPIKLVALAIEDWLCIFFSACMLVVGWWSCSQPSITHRTRFLITVALIVTGLCLLVCIALFLGMGIVFSPFNLMFAMLFSALAGSLIPWMTPTPRRRNAEKAAAAS